jgi:hypothetical protein
LLEGISVVVARGEVTTGFEVIHKSFAVAHGAFKGEMIERQCQAGFPLALGLRVGG